MAVKQQEYSWEKKTRAVEHSYVETGKNSSYRYNANTFSSHDTPKTSTVVVPKLSTEEREMSTFNIFSNKKESQKHSNRI